MKKEKKRKKHLKLKHWWGVKADITGSDTADGQVCVTPTSNEMYFKFQKKTAALVSFSNKLHA